MLTLNSQFVKNAAYQAVVQLTATNEGFVVEVQILYCTPYFHLIGDLGNKEVFANKELAEQNFYIEVEIQRRNAKNALGRQEEVLQKSMNSESLLYQKQMEEIMEAFKEAIPLDFKHQEGEIIYLYHNAVVIEYSSNEETVGCKILVGGEIIFDEITHLDDGYLINAQLAVHFFFNL